jgi:hypothetical protein
LALGRLRQGLVDAPGWISVYLSIAEPANQDWLASGFYTENSRENVGIWLNTDNLQSLLTSNAAFATIFNSFLPFFVRINRFFGSSDVRDALLIYALLFSGGSDGQTAAGLDSARQVAKAH